MCLAISLWIAEGHHCFPGNPLFTEMVQVPNNQTRLVPSGWVEVRSPTSANSGFCTTSYRFPIASHTFVNKPILNDTNLGAPSVSCWNLDYAMQPTPGLLPTMEAIRVHLICFCLCVFLQTVLFDMHVFDLFHKCY